MLNQTLLFTFVCLLLTQPIVSITEEELNTIKALYKQNQSNMSGLLANLPDNLFSKLLLHYNGFKDFLSSPTNMVYLHENYFSFMANYTIREESNFYKPIPNVTIPEYPHNINAEVRIYVEEAPEVDTLVNDIPRWNQGITFAVLTCNGPKKERYASFNNGTLLVGNLIHQNRAFKNSFQKFYEQEFGLLTLDLGEGEKRYMVTVMVAEIWNSLLIHPFHKHYQNIPDAFYTNLIYDISKIGMDLVGANVLYGDVTLENLCADVQTHGADGPTARPFLRLSDNTRLMEKDKDYTDSIKRYSGEYETNYFSTTFTGDSFTYSKELYEDSYALMITLKKFMDINEVAEKELNSDIYGRLKQAIKQTGNSKTYRQAWDIMSLYLNIKDILKTKGFISRILLI